MSTYQLQPSRDRRTWWASIGVTLVVLLAPVVPWLLLPEPEPEHSAVTVGSGETEAEVGLECAENRLAVLPTSWVCPGGVIITTYEERQTDDREKALRRMVRAFGITGESPSPKAEVLHAGEMTLLVDPSLDVVAMSKQSSSGDITSQIFAILEGQGGALNAATEAVWTTLTDEPRPERAL